MACVMSSSQREETRDPAEARAWRQLADAHGATADVCLRDGLRGRRDSAAITGGRQCTPRLLDWHRYARSNPLESRDDPIPELLDA